MGLDFIPSLKLLSCLLTSLLHNLLPSYSCPHTRICAMVQSCADRQREKLSTFIYWVFAIHVVISIIIYNLFHCSKAAGTTCEMWFLTKALDLAINS